MTTTGVQVPADPVVRTGALVAPLLTAAAVALVLTHWLRLLPLGFAAPGATRYEDFVDLLTPYAVAGPCLAALARAHAGRRTWVLGLAGAALFVQGHGLHLAANSISHARGPAAPAYLWDEQVGHALWFLGLAVLAAAVLVAVGPGGRPQPTGRPAGRTTALAVLVGLTWAANVVEAGQVPLGVAALAALGALGLRRPGSRLVLSACATALLVLTVYGLWQGGFPQPSELGWL